MGFNIFNPIANSKPAAAAASPVSCAESRGYFEIGYRADTAKSRSPSVQKSTREQH
jgi:hypothetical protein